MGNIIFPKDVEVGKFYLVPHVFTHDWYENLKNIYVPINCPKHSDIEYVGVRAIHYHVDWRFLNTRIYNKVCVDRTDQNHKIRSEAAYALFEIIAHGDEAGKKQIEDEIVYKEVKCKRHYSSWLLKSEAPKMYNSWPIKMQKGYCGQQLKLNEQGHYVCPHKGTIIDLKHIDEDGNIVCPAHQLRFDSKTLQAI